PPSTASWCTRRVGSTSGPAPSPTRPRCSSVALCVARVAHAVAGAAYGLDEIAPLPELLPQPLHVGIHRARMLIAAQLPDVSQQDLPRLQPSRPRHESREQLELEGGELDLVSVDVGAMRDLVDAHRTDAVAQ